MSLRVCSECRHEVGELFGYGPMGAVVCDSCACPSTSPTRSMSEPEYQELLTRVERLELALWFMIDSFEAAVTAHDRRYQGGQHVPYHGEFASATPSVVAVLERFARDLRGALRGQWPMTRSEYVSAYPEEDLSEIDRIFMERQP